MPDEISQHLQDSLIYLAITDTEFSKVIGGQIPSEFFSSDISQKVYEISIQYIRKFGKAPGIHFRDEIIPKLKKYDEADKEAVARYLMHLENIGEPNKEYVLSRLNDFIFETDAFINAEMKKGIVTCFEVRQIRLTD